MRHLSIHRRHPAARPLVLILALVLMGAFYSLVQPSTRSVADTNAASQIEDGKVIFDVTCSSCHGLNAEGTADGPSLIGVGAAAVDFQMGSGRMPMAKPEAQAPRKATQYTNEEIASVAAYVASLGAGPGIPTEEQYSPQGLTEEEIALGGELFRTNCSACHNFEGSGGALPHGRYAPTLKDVSAKHIYEAMRTGPQQMPVFSKEVMTDDDTRAIIGYLTDLHEQPSYGGLDLGGLGPVSEGLWGWVIGIGGLSLVAVWLARKGASSK